jgi:hypothetical protein
MKEPPRPQLCHVPVVAKLGFNAMMLARELPRLGPTAAGHPGLARAATTTEIGPLPGSFMARSTICIRFRLAPIA